MKKYIIATIIITAFIVLQACSKKDTGPVATGYEGFWTGKWPAASPVDSIQLNLKLGGTLDGKLRIYTNRTDGFAVDTVHGNWLFMDTILVLTTLSPTNNPRTFVIPKPNRDTLRGKIDGTFDFYLARKK